MSRRSRTILMVIIVFAFLAAAPFLILYALGYRFDRLTTEIRPTSTIAIRFEPRDVRVFLDNALQSEKRRFIKLDGLAPGDHTVRLEKDGYQNWEKLMPTTASEITWQEHVLLFANTPQHTTLGEALPGTMSMAPDGTQLSWWRQTSNQSPILVVHNIESNQQRAIELTGEAKLSVQQPAAVRWSPVGRYGFFETGLSGQTQNWIIDLAQAQPTVQAIEKNHPQLAIRSIVWDETNPEQLVILSNDRLFVLNARTLTLTPVVPSEQVLGVTATRLGIAYASKNDAVDGPQTVAIKTLSSADQQPTVRSADFASDCDRILIAWSRFDEIAIGDPCVGTLAVNEQPATSIPEILTISWAERASRGHSVLLVHATHELLAWHEENNTVDVLTRREAPITTAILNLKGTHVFYASGKEIAVHETDSLVGTPQAARILSSTNEAGVRDVVMGTVANNLYTIDRVGDQNQPVAEPQAMVLTLFED